MFPMMYRCSARFVALLACLPLLVALIACRGLLMQNAPPTPVDIKSAEVIGTHVFLVVLENQKYDVIVGRPPAPYLNSLIAQGGFATPFSANVHPSDPKYIHVTSGHT